MAGRVCAAILAMVTVACGSSAPDVPMPDIPGSGSVRALPQCESDGEASFFPGNLLTDPANLKPATDATRPIADLLHAMGERSLSCGPASDSYRLFWLSAFATSPGWEPTAIRITRGPNVWTIVVVRAQLRPQFRVIERHEQTLALDVSRGVVLAVDQFGFWTRPGFLANRDATDGRTWSVEGRHGNDYHAVVRVNEDENAVRKLALAFVNAAGIPPGHMVE